MTQRSAPPRERIQRAARFAALGDPQRLAIIDELAISDRSPVDLERRLDIRSNLLAHHLEVLEAAGLVTRHRSSGDARRRYVHLERDTLDDLAAFPRYRPTAALFICSHNSARSQLAAALWQSLTGRRGVSAGTHPAERVHPGAIAAARRAGLDIGDARPMPLDAIARRPPLVITVCDRAHEELDAPTTWLHWSIDDPVPGGTARHFDRVLEVIGARIDDTFSIGTRDG